MGISRAVRGDRRRRLDHLEVSAAMSDHEAIRLGKVPHKIWSSMDGSTAFDLAQRLELKPFSVKTHLEALRDLGLASTTEAFGPTSWRWWRTDRPVLPPNGVRMRRCIGHDCKIVFASTGFGHRMCADCRRGESGDPFDP